jgi:hypothetical protein
MNFITFDAAYALYPLATFEERRALSFSGNDERDLEALGKYATRGWSIISNIWPHEAKTTKASFYQDERRWVRDGLGWIVPLDKAGVESPPKVSPLSEKFTWDPVEYNSWMLVKAGKMYMAYDVVKPTIFRYGYLVSDRNLVAFLILFFQDQGSIEHKKTFNLTEQEKQASWTWCAHIRTRLIGCLYFTQVGCVPSRFYQSIYG